MPAASAPVHPHSPTGGTRARVAVVFGGRSTEHAISCLSAGTVKAALAEAGYDVVPVGVTRKGAWVLAAADQAYTVNGDLLPEVDAGESVTFSADATSPGLVTRTGERIPIDVVFPVLHGRFGEDGTVQGLLEMAGVPYVGSGVYASAVAMDKAHMKAALTGAGLPVAAFELVRPGATLPDGVMTRLGSPVFVKPARGGSSIGITRVTSPEGIPQALAAAAASDPKVIVEAAVNGLEIECGVLAGVAGGPPEASLPGEVTLAPGFEFYDFEAKYLSDATIFTAPAELSAEVTDEVRRLAIAAFEALDCAGLARVDVFVCPDGQVVVNELNTMPGFTAVSMYPRMWAATGVALPQLVCRLVEDALARAAVS